MTNQPMYTDPTGREYVIVSKSCVAGCGHITKKINVVYADGAKASFSEEVQSQHKRVETPAEKETRFQRQESIQDLRARADAVNF